VVISANQELKLATNGKGKGFSRPEDAGNGEATGGEWAGQESPELHDLGKGEADINHRRLFLTRLRKRGVKIPQKGSAGEGSLTAGRSQQT